MDGGTSAGSIPPIRPPSQWAEAQRTFAGLLADGVPVPATPVHVRWWTNAPSPALAGPDWISSAVVTVVLAVRALRRWYRRGPVGTVVGIWSADREPSGNPDLIFLADPAELPGPTGRAEASALGELAPNGALVVDLGGGCRVRPIYNPEVPWGELAEPWRR